MKNKNKIHLIIKYSKNMKYILGKIHRIVKLMIKYNIIHLKK